MRDSTARQKSPFMVNGSLEGENGATVSVSLSEEAVQIRLKVGQACPVNGGFRGGARLVAFCISKITF